MEMKEQSSLLQLLAKSFTVLNRAKSSLVVVGLLILFFGSIPLALKVLLKRNMSLPLLLLFPLVSLITQLCVSFLNNTCLRVLAAKATGDPETLGESFLRSVVPTVYGIIFNILFTILLAIPLAIGAGITFFIPSAGLFVIVLVGIYLGIHFVLGQFSIAFRDQGPISAFSYAWQLTSGKMLYVLGAILLSILIPALFIGIVGGSLFVAIPLYFEQSFSLANLSLGWMIVFAVLALLYCLMLLYLAAFWVLVFLELEAENSPVTSAPVRRPFLSDKPREGFGAFENKLPPQAAPTANATEVPQVEVLQASIHAAADNPEIHSHLDKVYQPKPEDIVEYKEEDRMPTILFDDEMAKQLEKEHAAWQAQKENHQDKRDDNDISSIKMSK